MELRHLRYFIRAAELLHFTRAAESLYISQPSLSIHIQQLEEELKTKLFVRVGRSVHLTEAGEMLLVRARRAVKELEEAEQEIEAMTGLLRGNLTLATIPLFGSRVLPQTIDAFCEKYPDIHITVRATRSEDVEAGLLAGTFDLGFSLSPPERTELNVKEVLSTRTVAIMSKTHPMAKKKSLTRQDIAALLLALPSHRISSARMMGQFFEAIEVQPNIAIEQDDGHALLELAKLGRFVTMLPIMAVKPDPDLVLVALPDPGIKVVVAAMWTQLTPASSTFLAMMNSNENSSLSADEGKE